MTVDGAVYGRDVRPCNARAEVTFAHKNGWVNTTGSDAGIVHSLPGKPRRDYIVVVFSNRPGGTATWTTATAGERSGQRFGS